jgi:AcrR family transcriptional regulator
MTPIPKDETKRQRIIRAAIRVFAEEGLSKGKIATIAQRAGIGKGTVYEYFSSKEEIFSAVLQDFFKQMVSGYGELGAAPLDPIRKIAMMLDYTFDYIDEHLKDEHGLEWMIFLEIFLQGFRDEFTGNQKFGFSQMLRELYNEFKPFIDEGIQSGVFRKMDSDHATFVLFAALDGIGLHYFINRGNYSKEILKTVTKKIFLDGILKTDSAKGA